jgi:hypothetical protein
MHRQTCSDPFARFEVVYEAFGAREWVVLRSAADGEPATLAFYDEWDRLKQEPVAGHLLLIYHDEEARTLLRVPLGVDQAAGC